MSELDNKVSNIDPWAKRLLAIASICYVVGFVLEKWHFALLRIEDPSFLKPQLILVGFCYFVYLILPAVPFVASGYLFAYSKKATSHIAVPLLLSIASFAVIALLLPVALGYFIPSYAIHTTYAERFSRFWQIIAGYRYPWIYLPLYISSFLLIIDLSQDKFTNSNFRKILCAIVLFFSLGSAEIYVRMARFEIDSSVGGANPRVITLYADDVINPLLSPRDFVENLTEGKDFSPLDRDFYYFILFYEDDDYLYLRHVSVDLDVKEKIEGSELISSRSFTYDGTYKVIVFPKNRVRSMRIESMYCVIDHVAGNSYTTNIYDYTGKAVKTLPKVNLSSEEN